MEVMILMEKRHYQQVSKLDLLESKFGRIKHRFLDTSTRDASWFMVRCLDSQDSNAILEKQRCAPTWSTATLAAMNVAPIIGPSTTSNFQKLV